MTKPDVVPMKNLCEVCKVPVVDPVLACVEAGCNVCIDCKMNNFRAYVLRCPKCNRFWETEEMKTLETFFEREIDNSMNEIHNPGRPISNNPFA